MNMSDLDVIYRQFSVPDMCRYFSDPPCNMEEAKKIIEHYYNLEEKIHMRYILLDKNTDAFIGTCGYHYYDSVRKQVEIGYDIWKDYWKQGYITEALPPLLNVCFEYLDVDCVYILCHPENKASIKSASKFGFEACELLRPIDVEPQICMKLTRSNWQKISKTVS